MTITQNIKTKLKNIRSNIKNPSRLFMNSAKKRMFYKNTSDVFLAGKKKRRKELAKILPPVNPQLVLPRDVGVKVIPKSARPASVFPMMDRCKKLIEAEAPGVAHNNKPFRTLLVTPQNLKGMPEFLDFALDPAVLSAATAYLGELPVLGSIHLWNDRQAGTELKGSQLYHCDFDDTHQFKIFVYISDVDKNAGPFTYLPAAVSQDIRNRMKYDWNYVKDENISPFIPAGTTGNQLLGQSGTMAMVDTSQCFHFGARVAEKDRYMAVFQYVTLSNFLFNPFYQFEPYKFAHLVKPEYSGVAKAVLDPAKY